MAGNRRPTDGEVKPLDAKDAPSVAPTDTIRDWLGSYALYIVLGVIVGSVAAPVFAGTVQTDETDNVVAIVPVQGSIDGSTAARVSSALAEARANETIDAVVLAVNSGGGGAAASEEMYFAVKRTTEQSEMPVVATVDAAAASGAYYTIAPSDQIYVKPASTVGSVGVLANLPNDAEPNDIVGATGPNKLSGSDTREFLYILDSLQTAFGNAVLEQRGENLTLSRTDLLQARVYSGGQAVQLGLADQIGDREAAIRAAARRAGLDSYSVRVLQSDNQTVRYLSRSAYLASDRPTKRLVPPGRLVGNETGGPVFLMVGPSYVVETNSTISALAADRALESANRSANSTDNESVVRPPGSVGPAEALRGDSPQTALGDPGGVDPPPAVGVEPAARGVMAHE